MKSLNLFLLISVLSILFSNSNAQNIVDLEDLSLPAESFWNGSDSSGQYQSENVIFGNVFNESGYGSWSSFAYTNITDTSGGYANQYAANTGGGYNASENYGIFYYSKYSAYNKAIDFNDIVDAQGIYITNSAWADSFILTGDGTDSLKYGGSSGNRADSLVLTIKAYDSSDDFTGDSINFYLADYTFSNSQDDYLIQDWTYVDLSSFTGISKLRFEISTSQSWTPTYVCFDNISYHPVMNIASNDKQQIEVFPNPVNNYLNISGPELSKIEIFNSLGKLVKSKKVNSSNCKINMANQAPGIYYLKSGNITKKIIKK